MVNGCVRRYRSSSSVGGKVEGMMKLPALNWR
jgi:hypothetical protein